MLDSDPVLLKITVTPESGEEFLLEAPYYPVELRAHVSRYLRTVITPESLHDMAAVQGILSRPIAEIAEFGYGDFDGDFRIGELMTLLAIHEARSAINPFDETLLRVYPAWQSKLQASALRSATGKGNWDGFLVGIPKVENNARPVVVPIEIKSTARDPLVPVEGTPAEQLEATAARFEQYFQQPGTISCVLLYPYSTEQDFVLNFRESASSIRAHVSDKSLGVICLLTFVEQDDRVVIELYCAFISDAGNHIEPEQWLRKIVF